MSLHIIDNMCIILYQQRNVIERMFGWLKENRRIVTRFDKLAKNYATMASLACAMRYLR
ncbi:hypothetical protein PSAN_24320 [Pseudomonas antarctica]|uniref:Transposase DDE domain-containing protein n=1 Tax=Pseudomonas antarctica TaxID=219572 RepID=A0ABQ7A031_9PSED|nr:hypothetical protein PSAN_24320 [Pseudomonas antarctica]